MKSFNQHAAIRGAIRRIFARSPIKREVLARARREVPRYNKDGSRAKKDAVQYLCNICKEWVGSTHVDVDHLEEVIPETGFTTWDDFIARLFCTADKLQVLCTECHDKKTLTERKRRQTITCNKELDDLEKALATNTDTTIVVKTIKKYLGKTKPEEIRERAKKLLEVYHLPLTYLQ